MMYSITHLYNIHICTDGLLLYSSGREILLLIFLTFPGASWNLSCSYLGFWMVLSIYLLQTCKLPAVILSASVFLQLLEDSNSTLCPSQVQTPVCSWSCSSFPEADGSERQQLYLAYFLLTAIHLGQLRGQLRGQLPGWLSGQLPTWLPG